MKPATGPRVDIRTRWLEAASAGRGGGARAAVPRCQVQSPDLGARLTSDSPVYEPLNIGSGASYRRKLERANSMISSARPLRTAFTI